MMKKNYFIALLAVVVNFASAQIEPTIYRGAFAPAPTAMWTDSWINWDPKITPYIDAATVVNVTTNINVNTTWTTGKTYKITGLIFVTGGATLTIQPGVVVKGVTTNTGTALIITKGSKLNAIGTPALPIVFTSAKTVAEGRQPGDWGGIILLGKAGFNVNAGINNIEGITASVNTEYGGGASPISADNSGTMKYCRIEFAGFVFSPNNEINGLTMGAVGSGTTIEFVQVSYCNDDAFEWFGGSVNCKHLVSFRNLDDDFDTDNGYNGLVQFGLAVRDPSFADNPAISTSEGFESDNNAGGTTVTNNTSAIFTNITMVGPSARAAQAPTSTLAVGYRNPARLRRATELKIYNSIFLDNRDNFLFIDGSATIANANANKLKFQNNIIAGVNSNIGFPSGINPTSLNSWFTTLNNNSHTVGSTTGILTATYGTSSSDYAAGSGAGTTASPFTGGVIDYRPGATAAIGALFTDSSISPFVVAVNNGTPVVSNRTYCRGESIAGISFATLSPTGVSLLWYTSALSTAVGSAITPAFSTGLAGTKTYFVAELNGTGTAGTIVSFTIVVNPAPTEVISTIVGTPPVGFTSSIAVGPNVGTTAQYTYTVTPFVNTTLVYAWTVPNGAALVSGQGTNSIVVNYLNVPSGAGSVGSVTLRAVNSFGCSGAIKALAITKILPLAPATFAMFNRNNTTTATSATTAVTNFGAFMANNRTATLVASSIVGATSYSWDLPTGVTVALPTNGVTTTSYSRWFTAEPFDAPLISQPSSGVGTKFWQIDYVDNTFLIDGVSTTVSTSTCLQKIAGSNPAKTFTFIIVAGAIGVNPTGTLFTYNGDTYNLTTATTASSLTVVCRAQSSLPGTFPTAVSTVITGTLTKVSDGTVTAFSRIQVAGFGATTSQTYPRYGTTGILVSTNRPTITIKFAGVTSNLSNLLYLGVRSKNGVGFSSISNAAVALANPSVPSLFTTNYSEVVTVPNVATLANGTSVYSLSGTTATTAKLLKLTSTLPLAPATLMLTNPAIGNGLTAVTNVSIYVGNTTTLRLTAAFSALASSYEWELPIGVVALPSADLSSRIIEVNFSGITPATLPATTILMRIGVKAKNGVGSSITSNAALVNPITSSTARLLSLTSSVPAAVATVNGQITALCGGTQYTYTIIASLLANSYIINAPAGSIVTSPSSLGNIVNTLSTSDLTFYVTYPVNFSVRPSTAIADKTIFIASVNGVGNSLTGRTIILSSALASVGVHSNSYINPITSSASLVLFGKCSTQTFSVPAVPFATSYIWTIQNGASIVGDSTGNSVVIDFAAVSTPTANTVNVVKVRAVNDCRFGLEKSITLTFDGITVCPGAKMASPSIASTVSIYPNPANDLFNIDLNMNANSEMTMAIYSINGTLVSFRKLNLNEGANNVSENISSLSSGLYFLEFNNLTNGEKEVKKLIKR